ncbi:hypothetical protein BD414DRAFT_481620 [Trametes punicea]|nr:hypothetical protein BD414DRAFT_481620 [Trametes punicea]
MKGAGGRQATAPHRGLANAGGMRGEMRVGIAWDVGALEASYGTCCSPREALPRVRSLCQSSRVAAVSCVFVHRFFARVCCCESGPCWSHSDAVQVARGAAVAATD